MLGRPRSRRSSGANSEQTDSTVKGRGPIPPTASISQTYYYLVTVQLPSSLSTQTRTIQLNAYNPYDPPTVMNGPGANAASSGTSAQINGLDYATDTLLSTNTAQTNSSGFANFIVADNVNEDVVVAATDVTSGSSPVGILQTPNLSFSVNEGSTPSYQIHRVDAEAEAEACPVAHRRAWWWS